jgi:hypothetical protein
MCRLYLRASILLAAAAATTTLLYVPLPARALDEVLYAEILERYTRDVSDLARVRVDYRALTASPDWKRLVQSLADSEPGRLRSRNEKLAFWANAYNILAIDLVVRHYPIDGIKDVGSLFSPVWKKSAGTIGDRSYSLDEIEHGIVRPLGDPRGHVAVVCASLSCPPLPRVPWSAVRLDDQLDDAMRLWLADPRKGLRIDRKTRTVHMSRIFEWFEEDFEASGGALAFVAPFLDDGDRAWLRDEGAGARIAYFDYDWSLNDLGRSAPGPGGS